MLNIFRRRDLVIRLVVGSILVMVSVAMVITLIPGLTGVDLDPTVRAVVAEVGREEITAWDIQQRVLQVGQMNRFPQEMMWLYTDQVLSEMVLEKATLQEARRMGLQVTEGELVARLRQDPELFPGGTFVGQQFYEDMVFSRFGMGVEQFEQRYREAMLVEKMRQMVTDAITVSAEEVREAFYQDNEKIVLSYVFIDPEDFRKDIRPAEEDLRAYYQENKDRYQIPEKRSAKILLIENQKLREATTVSEAELQKYYEDRKDDYRNEERVLVSHILLRAQENEPERIEQAKKKAAELSAKLKEGADFATLARENSEDETTAPKGGDLGWIVRNQTVPEFEKMAFSLPAGAISDPVQTTYGIHILKVEAHEPARLRPFEEVKAEIESTLLEDKVFAELPRLAEQASAALRRSPDDIKSVAERYHALPVSPPPFAQGEVISGVEESQALQQEIFALEKDQVSQPISVSGGYAVALLSEVFPAHQGEFVEVREKIQTDLVEEQAQSRVASKAEEMAKLLEQQGTKNLKTAARALGLVVKTSEPVTRTATIPSLGTVRDLDAQAFSRTMGEVAGPIPVRGGRLVYQVDSKQPPPEEDLANQQQILQERLLAQKRRVVFAIFQESLRNKLVADGDLKIHRDVLNQALPAASSTP